ncbi:ISA1214-6 transposase [mine drainage metagenome]|uniref:ISA1214-6 transposase n=2 Tax=mine drainage metagenome TaxID=410659 RepID=T0ZAC3_9ZZZZ
MLTREQVQLRLADLERLVQEEYKPQHPPKKRDWRTYEEQWAHRIRAVMRNLGPLVHEACSVERLEGPGPKSVLTLEQKVTLLLLKVLYEQSNRRMAGMLVTFSLLSGLDVSYKTVERLYSDPAVAVALENLHTLMLRRRGVRRIEATGDGTGFAVSITQHYATTATKEGDRAKENPPPPSSGEDPATSPAKKVRVFVYSFRLLDLRTWLYVAFGTSCRSERAAYGAAMAWLRAQGIEVDSVRLDRLYSGVSDAERFRGSRFYFLPKKDVKIHIQHEWLTSLQEFVEHPVAYLEEFYRREHSEAGFSADKRMLGWRIAQRRVDRIETADQCHSTWHNLLNLYGADRPSLSDPST